MKSIKKYKHEIFIAVSYIVSGMLIVQSCNWEMLLGLYLMLTANNSEQYLRIVEKVSSK